MYSHATLTLTYAFHITNLYFKSLLSISTPYICIHVCIYSSTLSTLYTLYIHIDTYIYICTLYILIYTVYTHRYFRPPVEDAKAIIIDFYRHIAMQDIRKNYRAQLEKPPLFCCATCHNRYSTIKSFEKHERKGDTAVEHKRQDQLAALYESQKYFLRRAKWLVTGTFFPAFFELSPEKSLPEDYIPQVFDSMGEEVRVCVYVCVCVCV